MKSQCLNDQVHARIMATMYTRNDLFNHMCKPGVVMDDGSDHDVSISKGLEFDIRVGAAGTTAVSSQQPGDHRFALARG